MRDKLFIFTAFSVVILLSMLSISPSMAEQVDAVSTATAEPCVADFDCNVVQLGYLTYLSFWVNLAGIRTVVLARNVFLHH